MVEGHQSAITDMNLNSAPRGFTIVELLIVIVVIGILATIVIVAYNGVQNRAFDTSVKNDLETMIKKIEMQTALSSGVYQALATTTDIKVNKSAYDIAENNLYYCRNTTTNQYAIGVRSKSKKDFKVVNGQVSENATKLYGADTCALVSSSGSSQVGYTQTTDTWATWAQ